MSASSPSRSSKPTPKFMPYEQVAQAFARYAAIQRGLCEALLLCDADPAVRAKLLALKAIIDHIEVTDDGA